MAWSCTSRDSYFRDNFPTAPLRTAMAKDGETANELSKSTGRIMIEESSSHLESSDEILMRQVQLDDRRAFEVLMKRYEIPLYNYLRRMTGNAHDAEDLFQETFLRIYRHASRFRDTGVFKPWAYRIATNLAKDCLKKRHRHREVALSDAGERSETYLKSTVPNPREEALGAEMASRLEIALADLPVKQRTVFLMARYDAMPYADIAQTLGIPVGTVKSRMNKAVKTLMGAMEEVGP